MLKKIVEAPVADLTQIEEKINCIQSEVSYVKKIYQKGKEKVKPKNKAERQADLKNRILKRAKIQK